ncbi:hypothetical protein EPN90_00320 [Patescibacteria group bacterium]|nr:MAG: hypothetical protein EPN90_00320 [Patescibacteria group bacterium]
MLLAISYLFSATPALAATSCPSPRGSFACSNPTYWVCGSGGDLFCKSPPPACQNNASYDCNSPSCACTCNSGYINCSGVCQVPKTNNCQPGQSFDPCTGACTGYGYALVGTPTPTVQSGNINITGQYLVNGSPVTGGLTGSGTANYLGKFTGSTALGTSLFFDSGVNIGLRTTAPGYALDIRDPGITAMIRIVNDDAAKKWTGIRLDRQGLLEKWFLGMSDTDDSFRIRRGGLTDDLIINAGVVQMAGFKLPSGAADGYVLTSDPTGAGSWRPLSCGVGKYDHLTASTYNGNLNGTAAGYSALTGTNSTICGAGSHICTPDELLATTRCGGTLPASGNVWVANGPPGFTSPAANDCSGFTTAAAGSYGAYWEFSASGGRGFATTCDQGLKIACCK